MAIVGAVIPPPPDRLTGNLAEDVSLIHEYLITFYQSLIVGSEILKRVDAISKIPKDLAAISSPPTKQDVDKVLEKLYNIIDAAGAIR